MRDAQLVTLESSQGTLIAKGEVSLQSLAGSDLEAALTHLVQGDCVAVTLDLTGVDYIDSAGLAVLVAAARHQMSQGRRLRAKLTVGGQPLRVIRLARFDLVIDVIEAEEVIEVGPALSAETADEEDGGKTYGQFLG